MADEFRGKAGSSEKELAAVERKIKEEQVSKHRAQADALKNLPSPTKTPTQGS